MAKANQKNKKPTGTKQMNADFDSLTATLLDMETSTQEIMPLFSKAIGLSISILKTYKKAFNVGTKYAE